MLLKVPYVFRLFARFRGAKKKLLIIKADAIGDYVLFRNFIETIKYSGKFKNHELHLLGNEIWRDLALHHDATHITNFIFTRPNHLYYSPWIVLRLGWQLFKGNYEVVLNPNSTRNFITDGFAGLTAAKHIIGFYSDTEGIPGKYKIKTDKFYTRLINLPSSVYFEFHRSRYFIEKVLGEPVNLTQPYFKLPVVKRKGILIFPGAGLPERGWQPERFAALINVLTRYTSQTIYIAGGSNEVSANNLITKLTTANNVINITGKTTVPELVSLIASSALVIGNDSSAIHIAAATSTPSVCITGGGHFRRFVPYPREIDNGPFCIYQKLPCYNCNWECMHQVTPQQTFPCIDEIDVERVWQSLAVNYPFISDSI
ncbi:glycosyltransferase family 9 protein [Mucilaginibacter hurinus]|uniref:glycosyltransferase family 9 protein n=1 Tax=Mucilaginibacter hurinus TaxID=2201324 RepID=UPI0013144FA3|nr:glycosyltransferase family 9 protein [Mucilaginibacter hurinus]